MFVSSCDHSLSKTTQRSRNTSTTDINVITKYLGEAKLGWFRGVPFLQGKHYKSSVLFPLECEHKTDSIPSFPNQESQSFLVLHHSSQGKQVAPGTLHCTWNNREPHMKNQFFPHKKSDLFAHCLGIQAQSLVFCCRLDP